jgi:signal transduction histidine kinase
MRLSGDVHTMSRRLHPSILDDLGLVEAVRAECARFSRREGIAVSIDAGNVPGDLPGNVKLCVYRILQEALRNVARHAGATRVRILLTDEGGLLRLAVEDDGKGFSPQGMDRRAGLGLISMKERTQQVGGDFSLDSGPGRGTVIRITVPTAAPGTPGWEAKHRERRSSDG